MSDLIEYEPEEIIKVGTSILFKRLKLLRYENEQLKQQLQETQAILKQLVELKKYRELNGKTLYYHANKEKLWDEAKLMVEGN